MENNFKCPVTKQETFIPTYSYNGTSYKDKKTKKILTCKCCETPQVLEYIDKPFEGYTKNLGKFSMMNKTEKQAHLKKRARDHSKKNNNSKDVKGWGL